MPTFAVSSITSVTYITHAQVAAIGVDTRGHWPTHLLAKWCSDAVSVVVTVI